MKRAAGDVIITFRLNVSEVARTNKARELHPFTVATQILSHNLCEMHADPSIVERGIIWNGVDVGEVKVDRVRGKER